MRQVRVVGVLGLVWLSACGSTTHQPGGEVSAGGSAAAGALSSGAVAGVLASAGNDTLGGANAAGGSSTQPTGDVSTPDGFCHGFYDIVIDVFAKCWGLSASQKQSLFSDPALCARFVDDVAQKRVGFEPTRAKACLDELRPVLDCDGTDMNAVPDCDVIQPLVPVGGMCSPSSDTTLGKECTGTAFCQSAQAYACNGVCTEPSPAGAACNPVTGSVRCAKGTTCDSATKQCVSLPPDAAEGKPCGDLPLGNCLDGLWCDRGSAASGAGVCTARKANGSCTRSTECQRALICAGPTGNKSCVAPKPVGASCTPGNSECNILAHCADDQKCSDVGAAVGERCGKLASGEALPCASGNYCDVLATGVCQAQKAPGAACTSNAIGECSGSLGHCDSETHVCVACP